MSKLRITAALLCLILLISLTACNDDDDPTIPGENPAPTLANIWPHADDSTWDFDLAYKEFDLPFPEEAKGDTSYTDGLPDMAALRADLQNPPSGTPTINETGIFRIELDGEVTTDSGVTTQNMATFLYFELPDKGPDQILTIKNASDPLLQMIADTCPDLRDAILPFLDLAAKDADDVKQPILLNGYAFSAEDDGYYSYGDVDADHS